MKMLLLYLIYLWSCHDIVQSIKLQKLFLVDESHTRKFPDNFNFGAATAAYQIEGGWNEDNRGPSIWDDLTHEHPEKITDHSNADESSYSYRYFEEDIKVLKYVGLNYYRFSVSWSRIMPTGDISSLNLAGLKYYEKLIDTLLENNIEPMITMYHYDLPSYLQKIGGLVNPLFIKYFVQYADILFENFGNKVKHWITFNEPSDFCKNGYGDGIDAPLIYAPGVGEYLCGHYVLIAHARTYHLYKNKYHKLKGKIGITVSSRFLYPADNTTVTEDDVHRAMDFELGWFMHPIFTESGNYPPIMISEVLKNSLLEGRIWSRLPTMSPADKKLIRGSADFFAINYYTSRYIEINHSNPDPDNPSFENDSRVIETVDSNWIKGKSSWLYSVPKGLGDLMRWIKDEYNNPEIIVTENGWSDNGELNDQGRINYLMDHLRELLKAIIDDKCNVTGYTVWSIIDNFEWLKGYTEKFGLYYVDFNSSNKTRTAKKSASILKTIIKTRQIID